MRKIRKQIDDMGVAAYLKMQGFKVVGRKGKNFFFDLPPEDEPEFDEKTFEFVNSVFHNYDANLMALKKMPNYVPPTDKVVG